VDRRHRGDLRGGLGPDEEDRAGAWSTTKRRGGSEAGRADAGAIAVRATTRTVAPAPARPLRVRPDRFASPGAPGARAAARPVAAPPTTQLTWAGVRCSRGDGFRPEAGRGWHPRTPPRSPRRSAPRSRATSKDGEQEPERQHRARQDQRHGAAPSRVDSMPPTSAPRARSTGRRSRVASDPT
jgi:hypothetical protein